VVRASRPSIFHAEFFGPRVAITTDQNQFITLSKLGRRLINIHLLEDQSLTGNSIAYPNSGSNKVERRYLKFVQTDENPGRVHINPDQYIEPIESSPTMKLKNTQK